MKLGTVLLIMTALCATYAAAKVEVAVNTDISGIYSDNIFKNADAMADFISRLHTDLILSTNALEFYLDASADFYLDYPEFNYFTLEPGIRFFQKLKGRNSLFADFSYMLLQHNDLYTDFNYNGPMLQTGIKLYPGKGMQLKAGYRLEGRNYANYDSFDFFNHNAFVDISRFFRTQTTLTVRGGFNYRYYSHIADTFVRGEGYNYYRHWRRMDRKKPPPNRPGTHALGIPSLYAGIGVNQGIGARLGIEGEIEVRRNFKGLDNADTLLKNAYAIYPFYDSYLWDGFRLGLKVKWTAFAGIALVAGMEYYDKKYRGVHLRDESGERIVPEEERTASLLVYSLKISKQFEKLELFSRMAYRDNRSNDLYFDFAAFTAAVGAAYYF